MTTLRIIAVIAANVMICASCQAEIISLDTNAWNHGSGAQTGWNNGELNGTTTFGGGTVEITSRTIGTAQATSNHMSRINESFFRGFAFQMDPGTTSPGVNGGGPTGYLRLDFEFSTQVNIDSFTLTDVDRANGQWWDTVIVEGFESGIGNPGSGTNANYSFNNPTNEEEIN